MKKGNKLVTLAMILLLVVSIVGCGKKTEDKVENTSGAAIATDAAVTDNATVSADGRVKILAFKDQVAYLDEIVVYMSSMKSQTESYYGPEVWSDAAAVEEIKAQSLDMIISVKLALQIAKQENIVADQATLDEYLTNVDTVYDSISQEIRDKFGITKDTVKQVLSDFAINIAVSEIKTKDLTVDPIEVETTMAQQDPTYELAKSYSYEEATKKVRAKHILFMTIDENNQPLPQADIDAALAKANDTIARINAGEDFDALTKELSTDPGKDTESYQDAEGNYIGYTFGKGEMVPAFEEAAYSMAVGEVSAPVQTDYGYHVIKLEEIIPSTPEDVAALKAAHEELRKSVEDTLKSQQFGGLLEQWKTDYNPTVDEPTWLAVDFSILFPATTTSGAAVETTN